MQKLTYDDSAAEKRRVIKYFEIDPTSHQHGVYIRDARLPAWLTEIFFDTLSRMDGCYKRSFYCQILESIAVGLYEGDFITLEERIHRYDLRHGQINILRTMADPMDNFKQGKEINDLLVVAADHQDGVAPANLGDFLVLVGELKRCLARRKPHMPTTISRRRRLDALENIIHPRTMVMHSDRGCPNKFGAWLIAAMENN